MKLIFKYIVLLGMVAGSFHKASAQMEDMQAKVSTAGKFVYLLEDQKVRKALRLVNADTLDRQAGLKSRVQQAAKEMKAAKKTGAGLFFNVTPIGEDMRVLVVCQYQDKSNTNIILYEVSMLFDPGKDGKIGTLTFNPQQYTKESTE
ncbi:hypothetical protein LX64_04208 [Chitinophaga skermanii]|uniref:DUF4252 domain-containing protein n=1 Tax=Chitinophaga skermanii TaxID=331697 RepID=A0A327Q872_9BACT|nr:hypothetical protein [Chitinophaga skermanii]RAJ00501.1 hypothetical protein LX64_04208 [Chitinophaga skermanii]